MAWLISEPGRVCPQEWAVLVLNPAYCEQGEGKLKKKPKHPLYLHLSSYLLVGRKEARGWDDSEVLNRRMVMLPGMKNMGERAGLEQGRKVMS